MNTFLKEYRWPLLASLFILALSFAPTFAGYAAQTPDWRFTGNFFDRQDYAVYMAMMQYGGQGHWDYQFRFTTEAHTGAYLRTFYVVLGHLTMWTKLAPQFIFDVARFIFGMLACLAIYRLMSRIFSADAPRRLAFILAIMGAGLGWLQAPLRLLPSPSVSPIDLWLIDAYVFFGLAVFPHFAAVIAALALAISLFLDYLAAPRWRHLFWIALCGLFVQITNPIAFILADCAMLGAFIFSCWRERKINRTAALGLGLLALVQIPVALYSLLLLTRDPVWAEYNRQNVTSSPTPLYYLLGFALFWPFAVAGAWHAIRKRDATAGWAVVWAAFALMLAYAPVAIQRRFLFALGIPLAALATPALLAFSEWLQRLRLSKFTGAAITVAFAMLTPLLMVLANAMDMSSHPDVMFEPAPLVEAVDWLGAHAKPDDVALGAQPTMEFIAMRTPLRLYAGHPMETLRYDEKMVQVENFFRGRQPETWLQSASVNWVVLGPHERQWAAGWLPNTHLEIAFENKLVTIYRVVSP